MKSLKKYKTLITLSGGLDSTYVLYEHLKNNPTENTLVFHLELIHNKEKRNKEELNACSNIVKELRKMGYTNFDYIGDSVFDYGSLPRISIKDIQIIAMFKAIILKTPQYSSIDTIKFGWHSGEVNREDINKGYRVKKCLRHWK
jgi:hypothetical protein